jgi:general secretion pathway protein E
MSGRRRNSASCTAPAAAIAAGSGYRGRKAIAEILNLNDDIRELIATRQPLKVIKEAARGNGTRLLREAAVDTVKRGETTLQEINRVTFVA